jgi:hypothetical protein
VSRDLLGEPKAPNLNNRQIGEAALIRAQTIGRTEPHPEIAMPDQAERFPTVVTSHGFNMRQTSFLALHLRSPFPRLRKTNAKNLGGFPISSEEEKRSPFKEAKQQMLSDRPYQKKRPPIRTEAASPRTSASIPFCSVPYTPLFTAGDQQIPSRNCGIRVAAMFGIEHNKKDGSGPAPAN